MKKHSIQTLTLLTGLALAAGSQADVIADAAGDYVAEAGSPTAALTTLPSGWSYLGADALNGGTEIALTAGAVGNQGASYQGFDGVSSFGTGAVYGTNTADPAEFEIFANGDANSGVVGTDLLIHPGQGGNADEFIIIRYTIGAADVTTAGSGEITGSFRELVIGNNSANGSVEVAVYQNSTSLFTTTGNQSTPNALTQAEGTFNLTGLTFAEGDTIDFVVGINGHFGADEVALNAQISGELVPEPGSLALMGLGGLAMMRRRRA